MNNISTIKGAFIISVLITVAVMAGIGYFVMHRQGIELDLANPIDNVDSAVKLQGQLNDRDAQIQAELDKE